MDRACPGLTDLSQASDLDLFLTGNLPAASEKLRWQVVGVRSCQVWTIIGGITDGPE